MSSKIAANKPFLALLLTTDIGQQKALMKTLTPDQSLVILEILFNLGNLDHDPEDFTFLKKKKRFLRKFNKDIALIKRKKALELHKNIVLKTLQHFQSKLLDLL